MAEVSGTITGSNGTEDIILNNAATEATLRLLLASTMQANKQTGDAIKDFAQKSGLSDDVFDRANEHVRNTGQTSSKLGQTFQTLDLIGQDVRRSFAQIHDTTSKLVSGTGSFADVANSMKNLPLTIGLVMGAFGELAAFQENMLKSYRAMSDSGANFSGSLTEMRLAAANTYMTLGEFTNIVKTNSTTLAKLGTSVTDGTRTFVNMSNNLISSGTGDKLLALGYSAEEINGSLLNFVGTTGRAANGQMASTSDLTEATGKYLEQLDAISQFTGVSRKQMEDDQKKAAAQAAYQRKLASMAPADAAKVKAAYDAASASGIKGATDLVMSTALGLPPMTEAARTLSGVLPDAAQGIVNMTNTAMDNNSSMEDVGVGFTNFMLGAKQNAEALGQTGDALTMMPGQVGEVVNSGIAAQNLMNAKGIQTAEDGQKAFAEIKRNQDKEARGSAANAAETEKAVKALGASILNGLMPIIQVLLTGINFVVQGFATVATWLGKVSGLLAGLGAVLVAIAVRQAMANIASTGNVLGNAGAKGIIGRMGQLGASAANPMYVVIVGGGAGGFDLPDADGKKGGKYKTGSSAPANRAARLATVQQGRMMQSITKGLSSINLAKMGRGALSLAKGAAGGLGSVAGGLLLDYGAQKADEANKPALAGSLDTLSSAATGAGIGATIGSVVPILGTAVGGAVGGIAGGVYGLVKNWDKMFKETEEDKKKKESDAKSKEKPVSKEEQEKITLMRKQVELMEAQRILAEQQLSHLDDINGNTDGGGFSWVRPGTR
jgi:hypothetical protein